MPIKLGILFVLLAGSTLFNLAAGHWVAAGLGAVMVIGIVRGSDGMRSIVRAAAFLGMALMAVAFLGAGIDVLGSYGHQYGYSIGAPGEGIASITMLATAVLFFAASSPYLFAFWAVGQPDVEDWMYQRTQSAALRDL